MADLTFLSGFSAVPIQEHIKQTNENLIRKACEYEPAAFNNLMYQMENYTGEARKILQDYICKIADEQPQALSYKFAKAFFNPESVDAQCFLVGYEKRYRSLVAKVPANAVKLKRMFTDIRVWCLWRLAESEDTTSTSHIKCLYDLSIKKHIFLAKALTVKKEWEEIKPLLTDSTNARQELITLCVNLQPSSKENCLLALEIYTEIWEEIVKESEELELDTLDRDKEIYTQALKASMKRGHSYRSAELFIEELPTKEQKINAWMKFFKKTLSPRAASELIAKNKAPDSSEKIDTLIGLYTILVMNGSFWEFKKLVNFLKTRKEDEQQRLLQLLIRNYIPSKEMYNIPLLSWLDDLLLEDDESLNYQLACIYQQMAKEQKEENESARWAVQCAGTFFARRAASSLDLPIELTLGAIDSDDIKRAFIQELEQMSNAGNKRASTLMKENAQPGTDLYTFTDAALLASLGQGERKGPLIVEMDD